MYEEKLEFNVLQGRVPEFKNDVVLSMKLNGVSTISVPEKGLYNVLVECDNATGRWNYTTWDLDIENIVNGKVRCSIDFNSVESKGNFVEYISNLNVNELVKDGTEDDNLRYIGANPNNYVKFNNELWRIIGVMNNIVDSYGNSASRIKLIRNDYLEKSLPFDKKTDGTTSNDWTKTTLMSILNGAYYNRSTISFDDRVLDYYNSGLTDDAKNMISSVIWNLGARSNATTAIEFYKSERSTTVKEGFPTTWLGNVGLMYVSDYGYAVGGNDRNTCLKKIIDSNYGENCYGNDYLVKDTAYKWTLSLTLGGTAFSIASSVDPYAPANMNARIQPVVYLDTNLILIDGNGTKNNPYILSVK